MITVQNTKLVKTFKKHPYKVDVRQFLVLLFDFVPNTKNYWRETFKTVNVLLVGTGKNPTTPLFSDTKKVKIF